MADPIGTIKGDQVRRFDTIQIIEHWIQAIAFIALAATGLVQRYPGSRVSQWFIDLFGGIEATRVIHRWFAVILMIGVVYHFVAIGYRKFVRREARGMLPGLDDLKAIGQTFRYGVGMAKSPPRQGRFTWEEKAEYWFLIWGTVVMVITGFLLWNPIATASILPGQFIPAAKEAHSGEALLAVLAVIVWHMYHVHIRSFNKSMFTGYLPRHEMEEEHSLELESIEAGEPQGITDPVEISRRSKLYFPVAAFGAVILLIGIYFFTTFEKTAISTVEPIEQAAIFAPVETTAPAVTTTTIAGTTTTVPDTTTVPPTGDGVGWEGTIAAFFDPACTMCHGSSGGLDLSSYDAAVAGGVSGAGIVPGDADASVIVQRMEAGGHPAVLDAEQLATLRDWVAAGAPLAGGDTPPPAASGDSWDAGIAEVFAAKCAMCHGSSGGLDLSSFDAAVAGGASGAGVVPGDPDASVIVQRMEAGGHPGMLDDAELERVRAWIADGAPQSGGVAAPDPGPAVETDFGWDTTVAAVFDPECTACHGADLQSGGLDLSSYDAAIAGGAGGAGVVPGDPNSSVIYTTMNRALTAGAHPKVITDAQLAILDEWIRGGAPEIGVPGAGSVEEPVDDAGEVVDVALTWDATFGPILADGCTGCHNADVFSGGLDLTTYESALGAIVPGDAAASQLFKVMNQALSGGAHPRVITDDQLELLQAWIDAGAPEN